MVMKPWLKLCYIFVMESRYESFILHSMQWPTPDMNVHVVQNCVEIRIFIGSVGSSYKFWL